MMNIAVSQDLARVRGSTDVINKKPQRAVSNDAALTLPATTDGTGVKTSAAAIQLLDSERGRRQATTYDQPSPQYQKALATYQQFENQTKREQIQQVFGVDLFA